MNTDIVARFAPEACTLPTAARPLRLAEFEEVFLLTTGIERIGEHELRLTLAGPTDLAQTVRDLAARETECCSFFGFTVTDLGGGRVRFEVVVPPAQREVLEAMAALAEAAPARATGAS